jgi:protein-S-isoprenylcysteine O-methyltransferase Ste14
MARILALLYGVAAYVLFVGVLLHAIVFVTGLPVAKTIDSGPVVPVEQAIIIDMLLMGLFAVQHSVMARQGFKRWWTRFVAPAVERSTYVLASSLALALLMWQWRPIPHLVWRITDAGFGNAILALALLGWLMVAASTFLISHFELFGLVQVTRSLLGREASPPKLRTPLFYRLVRHPLYLAFLIAFWAAPIMTVGHLIFTLFTTLYILAGVSLEERDLVDVFGEEYRRYRARVPMLLPLRWPF